ncbi:tail fiber protein [Labilibaculum sp. DW002]|uniref:Tail fiber protein n=1 Tax=Paralabilibaculum antarcticum TaxID=2912572 RepID=A0ABT5VSQ7_9BACT|nr:tail fiber protein [Labilibaculum sp. DW002]MDE5418451.1 tail fiber protein [Labilibaculum sp. DW002]
MTKLYSYFILTVLFFGNIHNINAQQTKNEVKGHFQNGYAPGAAHFGYLIDACYNYSIGEGLIYDTSNNLLKAEVPLSLLEQTLKDTATVIRNERDAKLEILSQQLLNNESSSSGAIDNLEQRLNNQIIDTASAIRQSINQLDLSKTIELEKTSQNIRAEINALNSETNSKLNNEVNLLNDRINTTNSSAEDIEQQLRLDFQSKLEQLDLDKTSQLADTAKNIRSKMYSLNSINQNKLNNEVILLNDKINSTQLAIQDTAQKVRLDFQFKLNLLEEALQDTAQIIRTSLNTFHNTLSQKIELGDYNLSNLINQTQNNLIKKIDSLAEVHNIERVIQENRMTKIETDHSTLKDTVVEMKTKLDTLNFTEENFSQTLKLKLANIEDGATKADNNFTDALKTKLDGIENSANNYQLPLGTHNKLGGIQLSQDFVLYNGKAYNALDASKIDREYAKDTIMKNWTSEMKTDDEWTRIRYKMENGLVDASGNKLYDYGEWNQAYKFIYDDLENSFYEFNATDSLNVILGIHERDKLFTGKNNTIIGHEAGYTLYKGGERNVLIGKNAGRGSENVFDNVFVGNQAGESIGDPSKSASTVGDFSGERNVALGTMAMQGRNASGKSVAIGYSAMELGEQNSSIAIGYNAAKQNSGNNNISIGYEAGLSVPGSTNTNTIAIGYRAGYKNTYAQHNIFIGDSSALVNESGEKNIFIGHGTGKSNTGNGNLFIGNDIDLAGNDQLAIGNKGNILISGDFTTNTINIDNLSTSNLTVGNSISNRYSIGNKVVINSASQFIGDGGVNSSAQIQTTHTNAKGNTNSAISALNGTVSAKYISGADAIMISNADVINNTGTFVGSGGVNTNGAINGNTLNANSIIGTDNLEIAGISIVTLSGGIPVERYAIKSHSHNPAEINTNSTNRFVSDAEKASWNNKVNTITGKGLSSEDFTSTEKAKLLGIAANANNYIHPTSHSANIITQDATHRFVNDTEKNTWNNKVDKATGKNLSTNDFTNTYKSKLDGITAGANKYTHPTTHTASIISQDANHRFVSDAEKTTWNAKADKSEVSSNDYTTTEKNKLAGIEDAANNYVHDANHSANMITTTTSKQFVSQTEKDEWTAGKIPLGGIIMWNGTTIPDGWALCDGQLVNGNQTPDLRGRFIVGSYPGKSGFDSGNNGGTVGSTPNNFNTNTNGTHNHAGNTGAYKLTPSDIPTHKHNFKNYYFIETSGKDDARTGTSFGFESIEQGGGAGDFDTDNNRVFYKNMDTESSGMSNPNSHTHTISSTGNHSHSVSVPYYVLAFIMRVK